MLVKVETYPWSHHRAIRVSSIIPQTKHSHSSTTAPHPDSLSLSLSLPPCWCSFPDVSDQFSANFFGTTVTSKRPHADWCFRSCSRFDHYITFHLCRCLMRCTARFDLRSRLVAWFALINAFGFGFPVKGRILSGLVVCTINGLLNMCCCS